MQAGLEHSQPAQAVQTSRVIAYFALLLIIANLVTPGGALAQIPIQFYLKDHLKLGPQQSAQFSLLINIPLYGAFLFGLVRDRWWPLGLRDRGYFLVFAPIGALAYVLLALRHDSYGQLVVGVLTITLVYRLIGPAVAGLTATVGNQLRMTGRLSSLVQFFGNVIAALISYVSGRVQSRLDPTLLFFLLAGAAICLFLFGFWHPKVVFDADEIREPKRHLGEDVLRLVRHRPLWPALLIWLTWAFGPGQGTPLFYYQTSTIHMSGEQVGTYGAIGALGFIPGLVAYGFLCRSVMPRKLLVWATLLAIPQMLPLSYITSVDGAYLASAFVGAVGGMAFAAYYDLLLRSCPRGLEATTIELGITGAVLVDRFGNLLGSWLYEHGGFALCNWITAAAYATILPMILLIPRETLAQPDGAPVGKRIED